MCCESEHAVGLLHYHLNHQWLNSPRLLTKVSEVYMIFSMRLFVAESAYILEYTYIYIYVCVRVYIHMCVCMYAFVYTEVSFIVWKEVKYCNIIFESMLLYLRWRKSDSKHDWHRGCHLGACWMNRNVCFSCACLNIHVKVSILIIEINDTRNQKHLGKISGHNLAKSCILAGRHLGGKSNKWKVVQTWMLHIM